MYTYRHIYLIPDISIQCLVKKFECSGCLHNLLKSWRTRKQNKELKEKTKEKLEATLTVFSCHLATQLLVSHSTIYYVMRKVVYPYKIYVLRELKSLDCGKRVHFVAGFFIMFTVIMMFLDTMFFSNEAWFHLSGYMNL